MSQELNTPIPIPVWMVRLAIWALGLLGAGAITSLLMVGAWVWKISENQSVIDSEVSSLKMKQFDIVNTLNTLEVQVRGDFSNIQSSLHEIERKVDVLQSRTP